MVCRLCLTETENSIEIFSEEKIRNCITTFLHLELTPDDPVSKVICALCWQQLEDFHTFCLRIEEAQKSMSRQLPDEFKEEGNATPMTEEVTLESANTESSFDLQVDDDIKSNDDTFDTDETLNEETAKPQLTALPSNQRITRASKLAALTTFKIEIPTDLQTKRKCARNNIKEIAEQQPPVQEEKVKQKIIAEVVKRKRGRPRKGEEKPKVERVRSKKGARIMKTAKEFDEIIQKNMNLTCDICSVNLIDFTELKRHFRAAHNRKGYAICCNKRLYKRGLCVDHINTHINPEHFKCPDCGKIMADRMCLRNHVLLLHQNEADKVFKCHYCPKKYAKQYLLDHHQVKHIPQDECTFICSVCNRGFPTKTTLTKHLNQKHSTVYDKMCEICAKLIRGKAAFERHMNEHEGKVQPQVQCEICDSWLKDKNSLRKHMYKHDGKSYSCDVCGKTSPSKSALQSHLIYVHQTVRQFHCTYCQKSFKKALSLREHLTTHTGEVLYTCPHCPRTFNSKANMHAHRKKKHREEWEATRRYNVKRAMSTEPSSTLS